MKWNLLSHPFVLHQWECQRNLFNKLYQKVYVLHARTLHFLSLLFFFIKRKKTTVHCIFFLYCIQKYSIFATWQKGDRKWKKKPIHYSSRRTSEIKIGPLRCKCWNNILHVGSKLLMYTVYKPRVSLSRAATPVKWSWWCWSKGPAMSCLFRDRGVLPMRRNTRMPYSLVITQRWLRTGREKDRGLLW